ncbi:cytochrome c biogenesis CcdA family protein [Ilumatobacter nonamiensis]|uniref:cytochrome c biogenesis CcdA family protein n=1 Tax=Ilumatobacter nonamiensis TaxID=467093 RepID=UPI0005913CD3|nr:cytochrome c biogenesis CcdA family protein [Ilumatobacter nonamiensis]
MSLWFVAGMLAAVNPCGFVLLPTYLMYFLGLQGAEGQRTQRETLRKALKVSASLSLGFMAVFIVAASLANYFTNWLTANAKYATGVFGVALIVLGAAMLFGFKLPFMNPQKLQGEKDQTVRSMFVYGVAYAIASLGCTIGFFISAVFATSRNGGAFAGLRNGIAYGAGMAVLVGGLTVALAFANTGLLKVLRHGLQYMDRIAAAFVLISGVYLLWYFYWVDLKEEGDAVTDWVTARQADISAFLNDHQWGVTVLMFSILGSTIAYVYTKRVDVLAGVVIAGVVVGGVWSSDWFAVGIIGTCVAAAGVLGLLQDRRDAANASGHGSDPQRDDSDSAGDGLRAADNQR